MTKILITGANGFVGQHLAPWLQQRGHDLRLASRTPAHGQFLFHITGPDTDWQAALADSEVVVHLAGIAHRQGVAAQDHQHVTVGSCQSLVAALKHAPNIKKIIFVSTAKIWGETSGSIANGPWTAASPPCPPDAYAAAKWQAEQILQQQDHAPVTILRPPLIYGPGVKANFARLLKICLTGLPGGLPLPLGSVDNRRSLLDVQALASAVEVIITTPPPDHRCYGLADDAPWATPALIRHLRDAMGGRLRLMPCPPTLLSTIAHGLGRGGAADRLLGNFWLDAQAFRDDFAWQPPRPATTALTSTATIFADLFREKFLKRV